MGIGKRSITPLRDVKVLDGTLYTDFGAIINLDHDSGECLPYQCSLIGLRLCE